MAEEEEELDYAAIVKQAMDNSVNSSFNSFQGNWGNAFTSINNIDIDSILKKLPSTRKSTVQTAVKNLSEAYNQNNLVLVIGAGISINYGLPGWNSLLQRLLMRTIAEEKSRATVLSKIFTKVFNPSPLIAGRYLQDSLSKETNKKNNFEIEVRNALYETFNTNHNSMIMNEIIKLCIAPGNSPNLDCLISYNYDDLIETKLRESGTGVQFQSIFGKGWNPDIKSLPIYHVHGFLPQEGKIDENNIITMGEFIYHEQYNAIYSWNNIVQINKFRDKTCLFIGSSLSDPNIRRLLDIANTQKNNNKFHYIVKIKPNRNEIIKLLKLLLSNDHDILNEKSETNIDFDYTIDFLIKIHDRFEERDSESLGVKTVWIDDFENDISEILKNIREKSL